jgi:NADPH:quinone reductase-like Zn-dependent oxidoreductase
MGAATTIDYRETARWGDAVRAATGGRGVDVAVEVGGAGTFDESAKALRFGETMSILGVLAGTQGPTRTPSFTRIYAFMASTSGPSPCWRTSPAGSSSRRSSR